MRLVYKYLLRNTGLVSSVASMLVLVLGLAFIIGYLRRAGDIKAMKEAAKNHAAHHLTIEDNERRLRQLEQDYQGALVKIGDLKRQFAEKYNNYDAAPSIALSSPLTHDTITTAIHKIELGDQTISACQQIVAAQDGALLLADAQIKSYRTVVASYKALETSNDVMRQELQRQLTIERTKKNLWKAGALAAAGLAVYAAAKK